MADDLRLYLKMLGMSVRAQMEYRASFWMISVSQFVVTVSEFGGVWVLFTRFRSLRGWSLAEVALLYGMVNVAFAIADGLARGFDTFGDLVKSGEFDRILLRPRGTALQIAGQSMMTRVGRLAQGAAILAWSLATLRLFGSPARLALIAATIVGSACLFYGLFMLQATAAFWTVETLELANTVTYGGTETAQYPFSIYRPWFRAFFTFVVPLAWVSYLPARAVLGRPERGGFPEPVLWIAPVVGVIFLLVAMQVWKVGVRHYRSTGS